MASEPATRQAKAIILAEHPVGVRPEVAPWPCILHHEVVLGLWLTRDTPVRSEANGHRAGLNYPRGEVANTIDIQLSN